MFGLYWGAWAACLPAIQDSTGATEAELGLGLLCVALAALPAMLAAGRLADVLGAKLVPLAILLFASAIVFPGLARSVPALYAALAFVGIGTGVLDIALNAQASSIEARYRVRVMDGLHAAFSIGVLCGGVGAGLLRRAGAHPSWILAGWDRLVAATVFANLIPPCRPSRLSGAARVERPLLVVGVVLGVAFLVESGLEGWSALFLERTFHPVRPISGLGPGSLRARWPPAACSHRRSTVPQWSPRMVFAGICASVGLIVAATAQQALLALLGLAIAGAGLALSAPTLFGTRRPARRPRRPRLRGFDRRDPRLPRVSRRPAPDRRSLRASRAFAAGSSSSARRRSSSPSALRCSANSGG